MKEDAQPERASKSDKGQGRSQVIKAQQQNVLGKAVECAQRGPRMALFGKKVHMVSASSALLTNKHVLYTCGDSLMYLCPCIRTHTDPEGNYMQAGMLAWQYW